MRDVAAIVENTGFTLATVAAAPAGWSGLSPSTVHFVNLAPGPGAAAFDSGKVVPQALIKVTYVTPTLVASEQTLADNFLATGQIEKKVNASQIVDNLLPANYSAN